MRTTLDIDQHSYRLAKAVAAQKGIRFGKLVAEAIRSQYGSAKEPNAALERSEAGFPVVTLGRPLTAEDISEALAE